MNSYNHILTKKEKLLITDIVMGTNYSGIFSGSKKHFRVKELFAKIIRKNTGKPFHIGNKWTNEFKDYSINLIWDKDTNETFFMHFFADPNYSYSSGTFEQFKELNSDINTVNNDGATALIFLAKNPNRYTLCNNLIHKYPNIDLNTKDKYGKTFHLYFFEHYTEDEISHKYNHKDLENFAIIEKIYKFETILFNWLDANISKDKEHILYVAEKCSMLVRVVNEKFDSSLQEEIKNIERIADKLHLEVTMEVNPTSQKKLKL